MVPEVKRRSKKHIHVFVSDEIIYYSETEKAKVNENVYFLVGVKEANPYDIC